MLRDDDKLGREAFYVACLAEAVALATALTGVAAVGEDIAQDSLLKTLDRFGELQNPSAYLRVVVVNGCRS